MHWSFIFLALCISFLFYNIERYMKYIMLITLHFNTLSIYWSRPHTTMVWNEICYTIFVQYHKKCLTTETFIKYHRLWNVHISGSVQTYTLYFRNLEFIYILIITQNITLSMPRNEGTENPSMEGYLVSNISVWKENPNASVECNRLVQSICSFRSQRFPVSPHHLTRK